MDAAAEVYQEMIPTFMSGTSGRGRNVLAGDEGEGMTLTECARNNTCYDCDDEQCWGRGDKGADCPKYHCDNPNGLQNCEECEFIDGFIEEMREQYGYKDRGLRIGRKRKNIPGRKDRDEK